MAVFACTTCGWVRRSLEADDHASCPVCDRPACALTPSGRLPRNRAQVAAATARALHDPALAGVPVRTRAEAA